MPIAPEPLVTPQSAGAAEGGLTAAQIADALASITGNANNKAATETASAWGLSEALLNDPVYGAELRNVLALLNKSDFAGARKALEESSFYKNNSTTVASRIKMKASQPGAYADALTKYKEAQKRRLVAAGVKVEGATLDDLLSKAYDSGLDDNQLDSMIIASGKMSASMGGAALGTIDQLKAYADSFGQEYNQSAWDNYSAQMFAGTTTAEDIKAKIRQDASSAFPAFADQFDKGTSLDAIASAYKTSMANILEVDPNTLKWTEPKLRRALQYTGPDGKPSVMPIWKFEQDLKNDPRWEYTDNARNTIDSMSLKVLRDWGLA